MDDAVWEITKLTQEEDILDSIAMHRMKKLEIKQVTLASRGFRMERGRFGGFEVPHV
jgi:hypothetical protein